MGVELAYTDAVARATDGLYTKVSRFIPKMEWHAYAPVIAEILIVACLGLAFVTAGSEAAAGGETIAQA